MEIIFMKATFFITAFSFLSGSLFAQPKFPGQWSLEADLGYTVPASGGMRGTSAEFQQDIQKNYNNKSYPFGDSRALTTVGSAILSYRFPSSAWSVYGAEYG